MYIPILLAKLLLSGTFFAAALLKLAPSNGVPRLLGAPPGRNNSRALLRILALVELIVAVALWIPATSPTAAAVILVLLMAFTCYLAHLHRSGLGRPCNCFGQLNLGKSARIASFRNATLGAVAAFVLTSASLGGAYARNTPDVVQVLAVWGIVAPFFLVAVLRMRVPSRGQSKTGSPAVAEGSLDLSSVVLPSMGGSRLVRFDSHDGSVLAVLCIDGECAECSALVGVAASWQVGQGRRAIVAAPRTYQGFAGSEGPTLALDQTFEVGRRMGAVSPPAAAMLNSLGSVSQVAYTHDGVREMLVMKAR